MDSSNQITKIIKRFLAQKKNSQLPTQKQWQYRWTMLSALLMAILIKSQASGLVLSLGLHLLLFMTAQCTTKMKGNAKQTKK